jgi:hypothetical protein
MKQLLVATGVFLLPAAIHAQEPKVQCPGEFSPIKRMWREVALAKGFITRDQLPEIPYAKAGKDQSFRRSALSAEEWTKLERTARLYWIEGKSRYDESGYPLGYHLITRG